MIQAESSPDALGRFLLLAAAIILVPGTLLLDVHTVPCVVLAVVTAALLAATVGSARFDWSRVSPRATLAHPVLVTMALVALGLAAPGVLAPLTGVLVLCFAFLGLTQPPGTSTIALLPAASAYLVVARDLSTTLLVRLAIAVLIWLLLGELLAQMSARQRMLTNALRAAADSDALTGVSNRRGWDARIVAAAPGDAVVLLDLDHFKQVNDVHGHGVGDEVLTDFGAMLALSLRGHDFCARLGGEEFALLLPDTSTEKITAVLARLHERWRNVRPGISFSGGIAICRADRATAATVAAADVALYCAKDAGRDTDRFEATEAVLLPL